MYRGSPLVDKYAVDLWATRHDEIHALGQLAGEEQAIRAVSRIVGLVECVDDDNHRSIGEARPRSCEDLQQEAAVAGGSVGEGHDPGDFVPEDQLSAHIRAGKRWGDKDSLEVEC